jgi:DNA (cytosine-5)-methyltransferase 1
MTLTFGSLFAGVGGFDMGFEQAGFECKFQVEWDKNCRSVLDRHWPDVEKWGDIINVNGRFLPPVDVIIFGSPCQDLSVAGARKGLSGERSGLFHEAVRIIKEMRDATNGTFPRWTVWENVAGALSSNNGRDFGTVINEMAKAGAVLQEYALLDAQHFGIPQRRRRVFLISCFDSAAAERCPDPLLPVTESLRGDTKKGKSKKQSAALTLTEGIGGDGAIVNAIGASIYHKSTVVNQDVNCGHLVTEGGILGSDIVGSLNTSDAKMISTQYVNENKCIVEPYLAFDTQFGSNANVTEDIAPTLKSSQQSPSVAYPIQDGREMEKHQNGFGVASDGEPSYTLDQTGAQAVAYSVREDAKANTFSATELDHANALSALRPSPQSHHAQMFIAQPMAVRRLTPIECERLMGWPDDHTRYKADGAEQADSHRYRQCGNGVASPVARWVAEHIAKVEYAKG